jgi:alpha-N-acetylglucosamine transferase
MGTRADMVMLVSPNMKEETWQVLQQDNTIITKVPNLVNPYKAKKAKGQSQCFLLHFEFTLNKLYMWNLTQYECVVYLDTDNIALGNFNKLFDCSHFCTMFMNPCNFHTGLLIIKPDMHQFEHRVHALYNHTHSYNSANQGFLTTFFPFKVCLLSTFSQCCVMGLG